MYKGIDGETASKSECHTKNLSGQEYTYGEIVFDHFVAVLDYIKPQDGEVFWDLGCGTGRPMVAAALAYPRLAACKGVELLEQLVELADEAIERTQ